MADGIDPRDFGRLETEVENLRSEVGALRKDVSELLALANKSKGGFWMGMTIASGFGGIVTLFAEHFLKR